jgi:S1-C subfamily serine protease
VGARRISGGAVGIVILVTVLAAGVIGLGANAFIHHATPLTPTPLAQAANPTGTSASLTPLAPAILATASPLPPVVATVPASSPVAVATIAPAEAFDPERLYAAVSPAVVTISNRQQSTARGSATSLANAGSGVIYDAHGYILTNRHVIDGAQTITVALVGGKSVAATLVGQDPVADIAVVKIDPAVVPAVAVFGDSSLVRSGQHVVAIGSPLQFETSITRGIISGTDRSVGGVDGLMQTDAQISPGNSGGPLINAQGQVIGITTASDRTNQTERVSFAIPSNYAKRLAEIIVTSGKVTRPYLGITTELLTPARSEELQVAVGRGAYVSDVSPNTPAAQAGIQKGDVIVAINAAQVESANPLAVLLLDFTPGETVSVTVNRSGTERQIPVILTERPASLDP